MKRDPRERRQANAQFRLTQSGPTSQCSARHFYSRFSALQSLTDPPEPTHIHTLPTQQFHGSTSHPANILPPSIRTLVLPRVSPKKAASLILDTPGPMHVLSSDYENFPANCEFLSARIQSFTACFLLHVSRIVCVECICRPTGLATKILS
jgi:hypothetical protein